MWPKLARDRVKEKCAHFWSVKMRAVFCYILENVADFPYRISVLLSNNFRILHRKVDKSRILFITVIPYPVSNLASPYY